MAVSHQSMLVCFCGPAGTGKTSICNAVKAEVPGTRLSVSTTTRPPRPSEQDGKDYHFVSVDEFERRVAHGSFLEHAVFSGHRYGTEKSEAEAALASGDDLLMDIEVQGVSQLRAAYGVRVVIVAVLPPSLEELRKRLVERGSDSANEIEHRLQIAQGELTTLRSEGFSDYFLLNDNLESGIIKAKAIVIAERCSTKHFPYR